MPSSRRLVFAPVNVAHIEDASSYFSNNMKNILKNIVQRTRVRGKDNV